MMESLREYPMLWALLAVLLGAAVFLFLRTGRNRSQTGDSPETLLSAKDMAELQEAFLHLTPDKLETVSGRELIFAVVTNVEAKLDAGVEFDALHLEQKYIYALWYFAQTITGREMSVFFREFGPPLTELVVPALTAVEREDWAGMVRDAYQAFDEDNEAASCDKATLEGLDETFKYAYTRAAFYDACEAFIRRHLDQFIDA